MRLEVLAFAMVTFLTEARVTTEPVLLSDTFDSGNTMNASPAGWKVSVPKGTTVRIVDSSVTEPFSAPYCVEMTDNSPTGRAEMYQDFPPAEAGRASAVFKLISPATAHAALQLRTAGGVHLCSVIFASNGFMRFEREGGGTSSSTPWTPRQWQKVQIEWFSDSTFNLSLADTQFVQRAHFVTNGVPGKIHVIVGYSTVTNRIGFVDDVKVVPAEPH